MSTPSEPVTIAIVTACMNANGSPEFAWTEVAATQEQIEAGIHYYLAEADLLEMGYQEPFVHFDATEGPPFLHAAVRDYVAGRHSLAKPAVSVLSEER